MVLDQPIDDAQLRDLERWMRDYDAWKEWFARWRNRREPGMFRAKARRPRPEPPEWLADACFNFAEDDQGSLADGCRAWREWSDGDYATLVIREKIAQARADQEAPQKSIWWEHIHVDALWPMAQSGSSAFGVLGVHATLQVTRRLGVFLAPGTILMRLPTQDGDRVWSAATDWGLSYRMFDFKMPVIGRPSTLHLNVARVWILGATFQPMDKELYLAGFSVSFKPRANQPKTK